MKNLEELRKILQNHKDNLKDEYAVNEIGIFGSYIKEEQIETSDIDILVDFTPGYVPGFFGLVDIQEQLSELFGGRKIDLRTPQDLSRYFRDKVLANAEVQYVRR